MQTPWTLIINVTSVTPPIVIAGLSPLLRLALDAERAGATALVLNGGGATLRACFSDPRLKLTLCNEAPQGQPRVTVPAHWVLHRRTFASMNLNAVPSGGTIGVPENLCPDMAFAFAPVAVVDPTSAKMAERLLFRSLRKAEDGWTSRWLNRYVSLSISRWLAKTSILPNQLSVVILAIGLYGAYLASRGDYTSMVVGATLFQLQSILDGCDGELSRITYRGSLLGEWLDTVGDDITNYSFFVGAALGLYRSTGSPLYLVVGSVMLLSGLIGSGFEYRYLIRIGSGDLLKYPLSQATSKRQGKFGFIAPLFKRDTFVFLTLVAAVLNVVGGALVAFAIGAVGVLVSVLLTERRMAKEGKARNP